MSDQNQNTEHDIIAIINNIFHLALSKDASDIHIEPKEEVLDIRIRIDGGFGEQLNYPVSQHQAITTRIKMLADLKIDENRLPQDGKASLKMDDQNIDLRISVLPTIYGEKICIRILKTDEAKVNLEDIGVLDYALKRIHETLETSHGIILVTGPTGAGKTTSLYGMLSHYDPKEYNISTLEDPVEYKMKDVNQTQIRKEIGFDFSDGLRSLVRQDPDIIMVGEIRDRETAALAIESALTGHLVFSTIHTNSAASTIQRLLNMGIEKYLLPSALRMIMAQRLVRKLCPDCAELYRPNSGVIEKIKNEVGNVLQIDEKELHLYKSKGCEKCHDTGFIKRTGIYEVMPISQTITEMILEGASAADLEQQAIKEGMLTMKQDGILKVVMGLTTLEEVISVIG
ncbi:type II/IV secretion system protein [Candidatus Peregrinibacteria bacterium]|jgi:type II secretory ATPase GspE/PulE/Tfp pilus assembly ATPase PilB-like protein|nr:type II/IV secretion system protein [Candidatus Peregrinibacteria bacterium]